MARLKVLVHSTFPYLLLQTYTCSGHCFLSNLSSFSLPTTSDDFSPVSISLIFSAGTSPECVSIFFVFHSSSLFPSLPPSLPPLPLPPSLLLSLSLSPTLGYHTECVQCVQIPIVEDDTVELDIEHFSVNISTKNTSVSIRRGSAVVTIHDDDSTFCSSTR